MHIRPTIYRCLVDLEMLERIQRRMKWFKHETDSVHSEKLNLLIENFGFEGYGRYWRLLETVAERMDSSNRCHAEYTVARWCEILKVKRKVLETFLKHLGNVFGIKAEQKENVLKITIPKLLKKRDNYTKNLKASCKELPNKEVEEKRIKNKRQESEIPDNPLVKKKEKNKRRFKFSERDLAIAKMILAGVQKLDGEFKKTNLDSWANEIRLMRERDNRTHNQIEEIFSWANNHHFWGANILSPGKLREKWSQLIIQKDTEGNGNGYRSQAEINSASSGQVVI